MTHNPGPPEVLSPHGGEVMFLQQALLGFKEPGFLCSLAQGPSGLRAGAEPPPPPLPGLQLFVSQTSFSGGKHQALNFKGQA